MAQSVSLFRFCALIVCVLLTGISTIRGADAAPAADNPLAKRGIHQRRINDTLPPLQLFDGTAATAEIVLANDRPVVAYAARELQQCLAAATGSEFKIVPRRSGALPAIVLGDCGWLRNGLGIDVGRLPRDGFVIKRVADTIVIAGRDDPHADPAEAVDKGIWAQMYERATLFGVYDFLEGFVGVRYYFPGDIGTVVPRHETLAVPAMDIVEAPDFAQRRTSWYRSGKSYLNPDAKRDFTLGSLWMYRLRGDTMLIPNCHGLARAGLVERFGQDHPEYFALLENGKRDNDTGLPGHRGHLCYSNPEFREEVYLDARDFLTGRPASVRGVRNKHGMSWSPSGFRPGFFNCMPQDGLGPLRFCHCQQCQPYVDNGTYAELVWEFTADIARRLQEDNVPGYITAMAYSMYKRVPEVDLPDNVLIMVAVPGPWMEREPEAQQQYDQLVRDWNDKVGTHKVWLWNYLNKYGGRSLPGIPTSTPRAVGSYYRRLGDDLSGAYLLSGTDLTIFNYLNWYVFSKLAWDSDADVEALLAEHDRLMFGAAAEPMGSFFRIIEDLWLDECLGETIESDLGPKTVGAPSERRLWEEIYSDAVIERLRGLFAGSEELAGDDPDSLERIRFIRKQFLGTIATEREAYVARQRRIAELSMAAPPVGEDQVPTIDGKLDDAAWQTATEVHLVPLESDADVLAPTTVRALWTPSTLYLAFDCREMLLEQLSYSDRGADDPAIWQDSSVEVFLNPSGDRQTYFQFLTNPAGSFTDVRISRLDTGEKDFDWDWNSRAKVGTRVTDTGWIAELAIPTADLAPEPLATGTRWVANLCRSRNLRDVAAADNQLYSWSPFLDEGFHDLDKFGTMHFVHEDRQGSSLIENGDFRQLDDRDRPTGWFLPREPEKRSRVTFDTETYIAGGRSLRIDSAEGSVAIMQRLPALQPNRRYRLTFFVRSEDVVPVPAEDGGSGACVNIWTSRNEWFPDNWYTGTMGWTKQGFTFSTDAKVNVDKVSYIRLRLDNAAGTVWYDDIRLTPTATDAPDPAAD